MRLETDRLAIRPLTPRDARFIFELVNEPPWLAYIGTKGVLTMKLTTKKGGLAGALIVREHQDLLFISENGMVQRTNAGGISQMGRATQGVRVMNMREDDRVSAVALVVESGASVADEESAAEEAGEPMVIATNEAGSDNGTVSEGDAS